MQQPLRKLYYRIGEVSRILGVETHVLRYWETEFPALSPRKNKAGQRVYRPREIELLLNIKKLLYEEGFTIAGARKQLARSAYRKPPDGAASEPEKPREAADASRAEKPKGSRPSKRLNEVRAELENILTLLDRE